MTICEEDFDLMRPAMEAAVREKPLISEYFHEELFRLAPEIRRLYQMDLVRQGELFVNRMSTIMARMHEAERLRPFVEDLALRHVGYGARPEHYPLVRQAMLIALRRLLGSAFTPEAEAAWSRTYDSIATVMINSAYGGSLAPDRPGRPDGS